MYPTEDELLQGVFTIWWYPTCLRDGRMSCSPVFTLGKSIQDKYFNSWTNFWQMDTWRLLRIWDWLPASCGDEYNGQYQAKRSDHFCLRSCIFCLKSLGMGKIALPHPRAPSFHCFVLYDLWSKGHCVATKVSHGISEGCQTWKCFQDYKRSQSSESYPKYSSSEDHPEYRVRLGGRNLESNCWEPVLNIAEPQHHNTLIGLWKSLYSPSLI